MQKKRGVGYRVKKFILVCIGHTLLGSVLFSPMLLIVAGAYVGGRYFDAKEGTLAGDGIATTATVFDATYDQVGSFLQGDVDNKLKRTGAQRHDGAKCTIYYRFTTEDGQEIEGSTNREYASLEAAKSEIGNRFEVIYSAADPNVYETRAGHTNSQSEAMYGISLAFLVIYVLCVFGTVLVPLAKKLQPKSREQRMKELKKKQKKDAERASPQSEIRQ